MIVSELYLSDPTSLLGSWSHWPWCFQIFHNHSPLATALRVHYSTWAMAPTKRSIGNCKEQPHLETSANLPQAAKWQLPQSSCKRLPSLVSNEILGKENLSRKPYVDRGIRQRFGGTFLRIWRNWVFCFVKLWGESQRRVSGSLTLATNWAIHNFNKKKLCISS